MAKYVKATQKPTASGSAQSSFLCCFHSAAADMDDVANTPTVIRPSGNMITYDSDDDEVDSTCTEHKLNRQDASVSVAYTDRISVGPDTSKPASHSYFDSSGSVKPSKLANNVHALWPASAAAREEPLDAPTTFVKVRRSESGADSASSVSLASLTDLKATPAVAYDFQDNYAVADAQHSDVDAMPTIAVTDTDSGAHTHTSALVADRHAEVGRLTLCITFDKPKSALLVEIRELLSLNMSAVSATNASSELEVDQHMSRDAKGDEKVEVHLALLPSKQQRRRTSAQPIRNARWNEQLRFDKVRAEKLNNLGLRVRLYLVRSRLFSTSNADNILCEAIIPFIDYPVVATNPFEFNLTMRWRDALAASITDLANASTPQYASAATSEASTPRASRAELAAVGNAARAASYANVNENRFNKTGSAARVSGSVSELSGSPSPRRSGFLKGLRSPPKNSRASSSKTDQRSGTLESSTDDLDFDPTITEERADEMDAENDAVGAVQFSLIYQVPRLTVVLLHFNVGRPSSKIRAKLQLTNKEGKTLAVAKSKKYSATDARKDGIIALEERFTFDLVQKHLPLEDAVITLTIYTKKKRVLGCLSIGAKCSTPDLKEHWNAVRIAAAASMGTPGTAHEAKAVAFACTERWHKLVAQL